MTIHTVAAASGVSPSTVSKVLNGRSDVSASTRARVEEAMDRQGYQRRRPARHRGGLIDLVLNELDSLWSIEIIRGVEEELRTSGVGLVLSAVHGRSADTRQWLEQLAARRSEGAILVVSELTLAQQSRMAALAVPYVLVDPVGDAVGGIPTIGATNWAGAVAATEHLTGLGHRRLAHLGGPRQLLCSRARADGFRAAVERAELTVDEALVSHGEFSAESGRAAMERILDRTDVPRPTAVFAASDLQALGCYEALRARGLRIPQDISVVGFDDLPVARWTDPGLTTVRQPLQEMAGMATRTLLRIIEGESVDLPRVELSTSLVQRGSCGPPE